MGGLQRVQGRGGRPDDGRGWEGRKQRREAWRVGAGGERRGTAVRWGKREWGSGGERGRVKQKE